MIAGPVDLYLILMAPIGVALVILVLRLIGGWRDAQLVDAAAARARLAEQEPAFEAEAVMMAAEGRARPRRPRRRRGCAARQRRRDER